MRRLENSEYSEELRAGFKAAEEAGKIIDEYFEKKYSSESKSDGSLVTEADVKSQEKIVEVLSEEFPDDGFLGEEEHLEPDVEERVWVIDPIDGTFNFDRGFKHFCVSIALKIDGETVLGIVYSPESSREETYFALKNSGSFRTSSGIENGKEISVSGHETVENSVFFISCFNIYEDELNSELEVLEELASRSAVQRQIGSCALEMCRVASGEADFHVVPIVKEWDWSAAKLILEEAGGEVLVRESKFPKCFEVVSSNGNVQEEVEEVVGDHFV